ncbi:MAG TPA: autotransporter-associated beta strand repeat-containing protein, partial [Pirellulaceae bacterium]|nr:autotransporter-associated beta strand repeat-containing protein [Pirellulaceae bacterium]
MSHTSPQRASYHLRARSALKRRLGIEKLEERALLAARVWDGEGTDGNWSNARNWAGDIAPLAGDDLIFAPQTGQLNITNDLASETTFNTITLSGSGYTIGGNAINLYGGLAANNVAGNNTFAIDVTLINGQSIIAANPQATLTFAGDINTANLIGTTFIFGTSGLTLDGAGSLNITGEISGAASLTKLGAGTATLSGNNSYEGITDVRQGVLVANHNQALGNALTGETQVQAGAALHVSGGRTIAEALAIREGGVGFGAGQDGSSLGALRSIGGNNTWTGGIELAADNNLIGVDAGSLLNITGVIAKGTSVIGGRRFVKVGDGTLRLSGSTPNLYAGETFVLNGTLELNKPAGVNAIGGSLVIGDQFSGDNTAVVRLLASNQIPMTDVVDVGLTTVTINSAGRLEFASSSIVETIGNLVLFTGPTYSADIDLNGGTLTLGGASLTLSQFQGSSGASPAATIADGTLDLGTFYSGAGGGFTKTFAISDTQIANVATDLNISARIVGDANASVTMTGSGTLQLGGNNSFAGPFLQTNGIVEVASNTAFGSGLISLQNSANVLRPIGAARTISNPISLDGNISTIGEFDLTFTGAITLSDNRTVLVMEPNQIVTFAAPVGEGIYGSRNLAKAGRGTLALTAANTYSGSTTTNSDGGTLVLSGSGSILNTSSITIGIASTLRLDNTAGNLGDRLHNLTSINNNGRLHFIGSASADSSEKVGPLAPVQNVQSIVEVENRSGGAFASLLTVNALTVGGDRPTRFVGTGLPLSATGKNRLSFTNNPGGLDDGILPQAIVYGPGGAVDFVTYDTSAEGFAIIPLPAEAYVTDLAQAGVTSNVRVSSNVTLSSSKSVNALLIDPGVTIAGENATLTINSGNLRLGAGSAIRTSYLNTGSGFVTVDGGAANISAAIYSGTIQKGGVGTLILSGDNQHSGSTNVNEGVLRIQHSNALGSPAGGTAVRSNAAIELEQTTFGPINVGLESLGNLDGTGGLTNAGALRNLAGNNSWAGTIGLGGNATNLLGVLGGFTVLNSNHAFMQAATGTTFTLTGDLTGGVDLVTLGGGTIEMAGVISRGQDRNNRILEGTLLLNNSPGIQASRGRYFVGTNLIGAPSATLRLGASDQIIDDRGVEVFASGLFDLAGNSDVIAGNLNLYVAASGAGQVSIGDGGTLTVNGNTQVLTQGAGHAVGAAITQGTFALQLFGTVTTPGTRTLLVNDGAVGADLTITSAIVDGTGLQSVGLIKNGFGELALGGNTANTFTGLTTVNEGTLTLSKTSGNAIGGALTIGDNNPQSGYAGSDLVRLTQPNQIPDYVAAIIINTTGRLSLQGNNDTIGNTDGQTAVTMQAASSIDTGAGELSINGNLVVGVANGATLWTPIAAVSISGNLNLGGVLRDISVQDRSELPADLILAANLRGSGGFRKIQQGDNQPATIQLTGNNSGLTGDVIYSVVGGNQPGVLAIGSDNALGSGRVITSPNAALVGFGGVWSIGNDFLIPTSTMTFGGGGSGNGWGGGNDLTLTGAVNLTGGTTTFNMPAAVTVNFAGGIGESFGTISQSGSALTKSGFGRMAISAPALVSGAVNISDQGGHLILRDQGTLRNANITVGYGAVLELDKSIGNHPDQLNSLNQGTESLAATVTLSGGTLALVGKPGEASTETIGAVIIANDRNGAIQSLVSPLVGSSADWRIYSVLRASTSVGANAAGGQQHQGAFVNFVARGTDFQTTGANRLNLTAPELLMSGILPYAVVTTIAGSLEFASYQNLSPGTTPYNNVIQALPTTSPTYATSFTGATLASNVKLTGGAFSPESIGQVVNAVLLVNGSTISGPAFTVRSGLVAAQGANNQILASMSFGPAVNSNYNSIEALFYVAAGSELLVGGNITENALSLPTNFSKAGPGRLTLAGDNDYIGITRLADGSLLATHNNAFGRASVANDVQIQYGTTVELANNITIPANKRALARGSGEATTGNVPLRNLNGTNTWLGGVDLQNNRTGIYVESGSKLILNAITNQPFNKLGAGTLQLSGGASGGGSIVWQGILELAKATGNVINSITIGDHV